MKYILSICGAAVLLSGCSQPKAQSHLADIESPARWSVPVGGANDGEHSVWQSFGDPELLRVIQMAMLTNPDLAVLAERIELARADGNRLIAPARPSLEASTELREGREHTRETGFQTEDIKPWSAGASFKWELDWLGKWRHKNEAGIQEFQATKADLEAGKLLLASEVANAWFQLRLHNRESHILNRASNYQSDILNIYKDLMQAGLVEPSILEQNEAVAAELNQKKIRARMNAEIQIRRLNRLTANTQARNNYQTAPLTGAQITIPGIPATLPPEVLSRRPDMTAAEARLKAAMALEKSAHLDLFPSLSLNLSGVTASGSLTDPFQSWITSFGPRLELPVWDPERMAQARIHSARAKIAAAEFRSAAIRALEEVEVALIKYNHRQSDLMLASERRARAKAVRDLTHNKRQAGLVSDLEVLEKEKGILNSELDEVRILADLLIDAVAVYRSMGISTSPVAEPGD